MTSILQEKKEKKPKEKARKSKYFIQTMKKLLYLVNMEKKKTTNATEKNERKTAVFPSKKKISIKNLSIYRESTIYMVAR